MSSTRKPFLKFSLASLAMLLTTGCGVESAREAAYRPRTQTTGSSEEAHRSSPGEKAAYDMAPTSQPMATPGRTSHAGPSSDSAPATPYASKPTSAAAPRGNDVLFGRRDLRSQEAIPSDGVVAPAGAGDKHDEIIENGFVQSVSNPLSTFSIDVDTASYAKTRMYLMQQHAMPRPDAVRIEEMINYFTYDYQPPQRSDHPFAANIEVATCPWNQEHQLVRIGIQGRKIDFDARPASNLVFLLDVSGSMNQPNKLPLLQRSMKMLVDQMGENDQVAIVVYAGAAGLVLDSTNGLNKQTIIDALDRLRAGGSTAGAAGIQLAYQIAQDHYITGGTNRVVLCTDGDFNVGVSNQTTLAAMVGERAKTGVHLTVLAFGMGNHNDAMLEQITNKGDGNYAFIDSDQEAQKVLVEEIGSTLVTIARDVKIQVEFNPALVGAYRLLGYENRMLAARDFNDDKKDAGEIGAGHSVTALYEVVPPSAAAEVGTPTVDDLKYQQKGALSAAADSDELLTVKLRYKPAERTVGKEDTSTKVSFTIKKSDLAFDDASADFQFAAAVAGFGMLLRNSEHKGQTNFDWVEETALGASQGDKSGYRREFVEMVRQAKRLGGG